MNKIKRISTIAIISINIIMIAYIASIIIPWTSIENINPYLPVFIQNFIFALEENGFSINSNYNAIPWNQLIAAPWSIGIWIFGLLVQLMGIMPTLACLWMLRALFKNYHEGNIFGDSNASYFKKIGILLFIDALIVTPLSDTLLIIAKTLNNPLGERIISINYGSTNIALLFCGLVMIIISMVMSEANKIHADQQLII